jgi:hypothetical protein
MRPPRDPRPFAIPLTDRQRAILEDMGHSRRRPHDDVQRATSSLQSADGARTRHFVEALRVSGPTVRLWRLRRWRPTKRPFQQDHGQALQVELCKASVGRPARPQTTRADHGPLDGHDQVCVGVGGPGGPHSSSPSGA